MLKEKKGTSNKIIHIGITFTLEMDMHAVTPVYGCPKIIKLWCTCTFSKGPIDQSLFALLGWLWLVAGANLL